MYMYVSSHRGFGVGPEMMPEILHHLKLKVDHYIQDGLKEGGREGGREGGK